MPGVAVLLCTYNGAKYLTPQLESIQSQDFGHCIVHVSDDGSSDDTLEVLRRWRDGQTDFDLRLRSGPGKGYAANFLSLLCAQDLSADYFAFADQDDLWDGDKLSRAVAALEGLAPGTPGLYCSRTRFLSEDGLRISGASPLFERPPAFANALVQNIAGGNTMVINAAARELLRRAGHVDVVSHDWWVYLLVSGAGGRVIYDPVPSLSYRQHTENAIGGNTGLLNRLKRYTGFLHGRNRAWYARNLKALSGCVELLTAENRVVLDEFQSMRGRGALARIAALRRGKVYAQTPLGNLGLFLATLFRKI